jgi:isochorismate synthase EntC
LDARGEGEFVVALRCGLLQGDTATLFAGSGIVDRSEPEREYVETCLKFQPMLKSLGAI